MNEPATEAKAQRRGAGPRHRLSPAHAAGVPSRAAERPNLFLLGAGKSGTTTLYAYLRQHPDIHMSPVKEPSFFCDIFQVIKNPVDYLRLFQSERNVRWRGEASHVYLSYPPAADCLQAFFPEARFIVIFRDPVERAYSLYHDMIARGAEWHWPFERALEAEDDRADCPVFRRQNPQYLYNFLYVRSGLYSEQVGRYLERFERERFLFLTFDELATDPRMTFRRLYSFLGVPPRAEPIHERHNPGRTVWSPKVQYFIRQRVEPVARRLFGGPGQRGCDKLCEWNTRWVIPPMRPETRERLRGRFQSDIARLEEQTGLDLAAWK